MRLQICRSFFWSFQINEELMFYTDIGTKVRALNCVRQSHHNDKKRLRACSDTLSYASTCL